jgi:hypothetical protein
MRRLLVIRQTSVQQLQLSKMMASMKCLAGVAVVEVSADVAKENSVVGEADVAISAAVEMASSAVGEEDVAVIVGMASTEAVVAEDVVARRAVDPEAQARRRVDRQRPESHSRSRILT